MSATFVHDQYLAQLSPDQEQGPPGPSFFAYSHVFYRDYQELIAPEGVQLYDGEDSTTGETTRLKFAVDPDTQTYTWQLQTEAPGSPRQLDEVTITPEAVACRRVIQHERVWTETEAAEPDATMKLVFGILSSSGFERTLQLVRNERAAGTRRLDLLLMTGQVLVDASTWHHGRVLNPADDYYSQFVVNFSRQARRGFAVSTVKPVGVLAG